jgi:hypothetical protein
MGDGPGEAKIIRMPGVNEPWKVKCHGSVKLRDEDGEYLRDAEGNVLTRPCSNWAVQFTMVCQAHGAGGTVANNPTKARAKQAREELRDKLKQLGDDAVAAVRSVMNDPEAKSADVLKAAEMVLSRFVPTKSEVDSNVHVSDARDLDAEIMEELGELPNASDEDESEADTG